MYLTQIYLDNFATTRIAPEVEKEMAHWLRDGYGNASSATHAAGWSAAEAVESARSEIAGLIDARRPSEVIFTSGATESNNTVLKGLDQIALGRKPHVVTTAIEHPSVLRTLEHLESAGKLTFSAVLPDPNGVVDPGAVDEAIRENTALVSVMAVNNEIGTAQPIGEIAKLARKRGVKFHVDASQAISKTEFSAKELGADFVSMSAHKINGPKGVGALWIRDGAKRSGLTPLLHGGGQEWGFRGGTLPVALIVGFGAAASVSAECWRSDKERVSELGTLLLQRLQRELPGIELNGSGRTRLPVCINISVEGVLSDALISAVPDLAISSGSACSSKHVGDSHVLKAMGLSAERRRTAIRIGLGRYTTNDEIAVAGDSLISAIRRLRISDHDR